MAASKNVKPVIMDDFKAPAPAVGFEISDDGAPVDPAKYVTLTSPSGAKTTVPSSIVDSLKESGYK